MTIPFAFFALLLLLVLVAAVFLRANPASVAGAIRLTGPVILGLVGGVLVFAGRAAIGGMMVAGAISWFGAVRKRRPASGPRNARTSVRTAALEMELDHDSGALEGIVLAGRFEGRRLADMALADLTALHGELAGDTESLQLLETYLDGKFPFWRDGMDAHDGAGERSAPRAGRMTQQEAYQVLGLEAGASASDVRKAHRRLMQRLHPDVGGSSFLASRINEARDVLLSEHH